uniref:Conserved oligomeric Golgi complex subunit 8 n=1 Tax=Pipistrellus kuhlii TaxID=59472 RepID=A0A7J7V0I4_PIPKU|nr:hypothetical protein mPipKuh1_008639 [Pipistrellus kuhlii]
MAAMEAIPSSATAPATATAAALGEVEDEGLLASLFRDRFPEAQWRERPDVGRYLRELSGSGLERLRREPERLAEERAQLLQQTRDLAFANYKTFIRGAECTERIHRLFGDVEASVGHLLDRLPSFQQSCRNFVKEAEEISASRRMNTLTLNRHTEILEILEIPQLMDTCVRNSYYEEALELAAYVRRLEKKYSSIPVIQVTKVILGFHRAEEAAFTSGERELFIQFCTVFLEDLVPYLNRCLQVLFPPAQIAQTLGIPPTQLSKYGNLGHVNVSIVQEPLASILPKKETVFCLDEREPVPELTAPAPAAAPEPELPAEESSLQPITPAFPEEGQEQVESSEPLQADVPSEST